MEIDIVGFVLLDVVDASEVVLSVFYNQNKKFIILVESTSVMLSLSCFSFSDVMLVECRSDVDFAVAATDEVTEISTDYQHN